MSAAGDAAGVHVNRNDGVVTVELCRPIAKNAINEDDIDTLIGELRNTRDSSADRALILTGCAGSFCAGIDLAKPLRRPMPRFMRRVGELICELYHLPIPTVAAVRGPAVGLGFSLALACDLVVAEEDAYFGMPFHKRGLVLDGGASWLLPQRIGLGRAKQVALIADRISAPAAQAMGIANTVVPETGFDATVEDWARRLAAGPPIAQQLSKELLNSSANSSLEVALTAEANAQSLAFVGGESKEGVRAFLGKREPAFPDA